MSPSEKKSMIRADHPLLGVSGQCRLLKLSRWALNLRPS
jgi:hypothetical protein